ncbi:ribonuclease HII [Candidatus Woesearchaeota archaeon]|nr:ribonuclease HII [Candidatus Woesearchaeota archaeon]MBW3014406.1 ribonuclease HII [Candidatus Woesearchaeota archaeon]
MIIAGIDEAGRGPVIGPMVMCGVSIEEEKVRELVNLGVKDSKMLTPAVRTLMAKDIRKIIKDYRLVIVEPQEIDRALNNPSLNLNLLEALKSAEIIDFLNPDQVVLDCPSTNPKAFKLDVEKKLAKTTKTEIIAQHKADVEFPVCAAASILAKVTRDELIEKIKAQLSIDFGSGYASDPKTVIFLEENWENEKFSPIFRKTWESWRRLKRAKTQTNLAQW